jgi:hypothetical protein
MRAVVISLALGAGHQNAYWPEGYPWNYKVGYTTVQGMRCPNHQMQVKFMEDVVAPYASSPVYLHQCSHKCTPGSNSGCRGKVGGKTGLVPGREPGESYNVPCFCDGYCANANSEYCDAPDTEAEFSICGDLSLCQALCDASPECYGIEMATGSNRCYLLYSDCQLKLLRGELTPSTSYDYYARMDPENRGGDESCPLGVAVLASGLEDVAMTCPALGISDQYEPLAGAVGTFVSTTGECAVLQWSYTGCGWVVTAPAPEIDSGPVVGPGSCTSDFCSNDPYAANWIFGTNDPSEYKEDICEDTEPWLSTGYCANKLWQALCPESCLELTCDVCSSWENDNEPALRLSLPCSSSPSMRPRVATFSSRSECVPTRSSRESVRLRAPSSRGALRTSAARSGSSCCRGAPSTAPSSAAR